MSVGKANSLRLSLDADGACKKDIVNVDCAFISKAFCRVRGKSRD